MKNLKTYRHGLTLLLAIMIVSGLRSQISDTICIPKKDAVKLLTKAEEGKLLGEKVTLLNEQIFLLGERIKEKEQIVAAYDQINIAHDSLINNYKAEIEAMKGQRKIFEQALKDTQKEVKRYKRRLFFRTAGGLLLTGGLTYLYLTK